MKMEVPKISIVIPAYNAESTITETIESVQKQTFSDFEVIIVDDGSTDKTVEVINNIHDERIKVISYENGGNALARNRGIKNAKGEFIAFIDADDMWTPDKLELQLAALEKYPEAGIAYSWTYFKYEKEEDSYADCSSFFEGNVYRDLLVKNFLQNGSNPLIRKQVIDSIGFFNPTLKCSVDWDFYLRLAAKCNFVLVQKPQVIYRQSSNSITSKTDVMKKYMLIVIDRAFTEAPKELQHLKKQSIAWVHNYIAHQHLKYKTNQIKDLSLVGYELCQATYIYPKILLEAYTQSLIRQFLKRCLSVQFGLI